MTGGTITMQADLSVDGLKRLTSFVARMEASLVRYTEHPCKSCAFIK